MEVCLTDMNGVEATRQILRLLPATRIVIFSSEASRALVDEALQAGALGYLSKGGSSDELFRAIDLVSEGKPYLSPEINLVLLEDHQKSLLADRQPPTPPLSERDKRLLRLIAEGRRSKEIAQHLSLRCGTVSTYRARLMKKLSCASLAELVRYAVREKIVNA